MTIDEFSIINRFFKQPITKESSIECGIGDDAAVIRWPTHKSLVTAVDTLIEGRHFYPNTSPHALGYKALAVNLSDLAAMGATPKWCTLALSLPQANEQWLQLFSEGLFTCAHSYGVTLIGGDTTRGHLSVSVTVLGELASESKPLLRSGAQVGDAIYLGGDLGGAAAATAQLAHHEPESLAPSLLQALYYPTPQVRLGQTLLGHATSAIDVSDGLIQDLNHILQQSGGLGAELWQTKLPIAADLTTEYSLAKQLDFFLYGGDDYKLCFTLPQQDSCTLSELKKLGVYQIGKITEKPEIILKNGVAKTTLPIKGWDHFN